MTDTTRSDCAVKAFGGFKSDRRAFWFAKQTVGELLKNVLKDRKDAASGKCQENIEIR